MTGSAGRLPGILLAGGLLVLAAIVAAGTLAIPQSTYAMVGPRVIPWCLALLLVGFGGLLLAQALRGGLQPEDFGAEPLDRIALSWVVAGLVLNVATIKLLGFTAASILLFVCVARGFGSRAILRDAVIGGAMALITFLGFSKWLGVDFGGGLIESWF